MNKLAFAVAYNTHTVFLLPRTLESIGEARVFLVPCGPGVVPGALQASGDVEQLPTAADNSSGWQAALTAAKAKGFTHVFLLEAGEVLAPKGHPSIDAAKNWATIGMAISEDLAVALPPTGLPAEGTRALLDLVAAEIPPGAGSYGVVVPLVMDGAGLDCRTYAAAWRLVSVEGAVPARTVVQDLVVLKQPPAQVFFEMGALAHTIAVGGVTPAHDAITQRAFRLARAVVEKEEAFKAFDTLYTYYSLNEELWRLEELMRVLPFSLEEDSRMEHYRALLKKQTGHLSLSSGREVDWYADGSPGVVVNDGYAASVHLTGMPVRLSWLVAECRKRGAKKAVELGSVDGVSLFPLLGAAPDIEWHGVEVSKAAVAHGNEVAARIGVRDRFHLHNAKSFPKFADENARTFDAVSVFEVLEHNSPATGHLILTSAERLLRKPTRGVDPRVYISTPSGSWSICDEKTRDLNIHKDHINAYTPARMRRFLEERGAKDIEVQEVENPDFREANAWVFASYIPSW